MKTYSLRKLLPGVLLVALACHDSADRKAEDNNSPKHGLNESVGAQIPYEQAIEWIGYYDKTNNTNTAGREGSQYYIDPSMLNTVLSSVPDLVGIAFQHAQDSDGTHHFIIIPVGATRQLWSPGSQVIVDANTNTIIEKELAQRWVDHYETEHPGEIRFHFFGADIFRDEITVIPGFSELEITRAITAEGVPKLLLWAFNNDTGGRTKGTTPVFNESQPCPPRCS